ncbi:MAG: CoB--CoM heterodisulfide reductase subunit C [Candidatus Hecatellales archaeon]|nr:MAG: CoB--CoM heterodisulfide reductase subunit C [Candidatus Hecatellales archaeon]
MAEGQATPTLCLFTWKFADEIIARGGKIFDAEDLKTVYACIQCGTCTGGCPAGRYTSLRTRVVIRNIQLGLRENVLESDDLWACTTCYSCQERCPRNVMITDIIRVARNISFEEGHARKAHLYVSRNFLEIGHSIKFTEEHRKLRESVEVQPVPPTVLSYPEAMKEVSKLTELSGFKQKIEAYGGK